MDLAEGQIIKVHRNEEVPADIVILLTSVQDVGQIHLDTINLDGESNLKEKHALYKQVECSNHNDQVEADKREDIIVSKIFNKVIHTS
jgi:magnesium-transporting ATPase (P-type)